VETYSWASSLHGLSFNKYETFINYIFVVKDRLHAKKFIEISLNCIKMKFHVVMNRMLILIKIRSEENLLLLMKWKNG
jgi:hypothetical protein